MKLPFIALCAVLTAATQAKAAEGSLCYQSSTAYMSEPPPGWVAEFKRAREVGLCVAYVLKGYDFDSSPAVLYPQLTGNFERDAKGAIDLDSFIKADLEHFQEAAPGLSMQAEPGAALPDGLPLQVRRLKNGPRPTEAELIGYTATTDAVLVIVLSARSDEKLAQYRPAWTRFVSTMKRVSRADLYAAEKAMADKDTATPKGAKYETAWMKRMAPVLSTVMTSCARKGGVPNFQAIFQVLADGSTQDINFDREGDAVDCVKEGLMSFHGPNPPHAPFHIELRMTTE